MHLFAQSPLRANPKTVTNDQHPNHQLRIDRRSARVAIKRGEVGAQICEIEKLINAAKQMIGRNVVVKVERVEQAVLITAGLSHHLSNLPLICLINKTSMAALSSRVFQQNRPAADARRA